MNTSTVQVDEAAIARPKYYEMDGALRANANRAWLLAFLTIPIALVAIGFAIFVRMQPPTVIRIGPNGDASVPVSYTHLDVYKRQAYDSPVE